MFSIFNVGLVGVSSPGSILTIMIMAASGDRIKILVSILAAAAISLLVAIPFVKKANSNDEQLKTAAKEMEALKGKRSSVSSVFAISATEEDVDFTNISQIAYACDAGLGSSVMGAGILQKKLKASGIDDINVFHTSIANLPTKCQVIVAHQTLMERVKEKQPDAYYLEITDYLNAPEYDELINNIKTARGKIDRG